MGATLSNSRKGVLLNKWESTIEYDDTPNRREAVNVGGYLVNAQINSEITEVIISEGDNEVVTLGDYFGVNMIKSDASVVSADYFNSTAAMMTGTNSCLLSLQPLEVQLVLEDDYQEFNYDALR